MRAWNYVVYEGQKRLAHLYSWVMKTSGERDRKLKIVRANRELRRQNKSLEDFLGIKIQQGVDKYVSEARKLMTEYESVTKEIVTSALTRREPELSEKTKAYYIPNSAVLPIVLKILSKEDRTFRGAPLAVLSKGEEIYTSRNFSRICKLGTNEISDLIKQHSDGLIKLRKGRTYTIEQEGFDLIFHKFFAEDIYGAEDIGIYAVPHIEGKKKLGKLMKGLGSSAINRLQRIYGALITPEEDYGGLIHETVRD